MVRSHLYLLRSPETHICGAHSLSNFRGETKSHRPNRFTRKMSRYLIRGFCHPALCCARARVCCMFIYAHKNLAFCLIDGPYHFPRLYSHALSLAEHKYDQKNGPNKCAVERSCVICAVRLIRKCVAGPELLIHSKPVAIVRVACKIASISPTFRAPSNYPITFCSFFRSFACYFMFQSIPSPSPSRSPG